MSLAETFPHYYACMNFAFLCGSVRVVWGKKPDDYLRCACDTEELTDGERIRVLRLRSGLTIRQAAEQVGICRHTLMNYENGRAKVKSEVSDRHNDFLNKLKAHSIPKQELANLYNP